MHLCMCMNTHLVNHKFFNKEHERIVYVDTDAYNDDDAGGYTSEL